MPGIPMRESTQPIDLKQFTIFAISKQTGIYVCKILWCWLNGRRERIQTLDL